jgi:pimeloyl-ACP methyl ester carboxylesterase
LSGVLVAGRGFVNTLGPLQASHDLVVIDQRGVSGKDALICGPDGPADSAASYAASAFRVDYVRKCAATYANRYDPTTFNTPTFARDLEEVRKALDYDSVRLVGTGYSSLIAIGYMRDHPDRVSSALFVDLVATDDPLQMLRPQAGFAALEAVVEACERDQPCRTFHPRVREDFDTLMSRLNQGGIDTTVTFDGRDQPVRLDGETVLFWLFGHFHFMADVAGIPSEIHALVAGDPSEQSAVARKALAAHAALYSYYAMGTYFSVMCTEDVPYMGDLGAAPDPVSAIYARQIVQLRDACGAWPHVERTPPSPLAPASIAAPVLIIQPETSPESPPQALGHAAAPFAHATILTMAAHGTGFDDDWTICPKPEAVAFLDSDGKAPIDVHCGEHFRFRPFVLE